MEVLEEKPRPIYTMPTTNPTWTCLGLKLGLYAVTTVTKTLNQDKVYKKNKMQEDRWPKRIQIASYQETSKDEKRIERTNSRSDEGGVKPDDVQNLLNYRLWREESCAGVYTKLTIRSLKSMKHQKVWEGSVVGDFTLVVRREGIYWC